ncbi:MAG TPA: hypothetical protein VG537_03485 [Candidatus Kapabacteria bacterium]|jgi:hypothetical protein|nr:hypothetical protein [Candidatus Kapabacteria bacterium]
MEQANPNEEHSKNTGGQPNTSDRTSANNSSSRINEHDATTPLVVKKKTIKQRVLSIALWLLLIVFVLGISGLIFTQLPIFRRLIVNELVSTVESSTNGTLVIKDVEGNILNGFVMNDVSLKLRTGTKYDSVAILHADRILADYSLIRWLRKNEIGITNMVIERPVIRLLKFAGDTVWNYNLLFKPVATAPKAPPKPFTQLVDLTSLRIQDGSVIVRNYNYPARPTPTVGAIAQVKEQEIDWSDAQVEGLDLDSRLYANGSAAQSVKVNHLRFTEKQSGFFVQHLEFAGYIDSIQARIDNAKITTGHSNLAFSVEAEPPSIIKTGLLRSMEHANVALTLKGPTISTYELKQFLPKPLGFLNGSPGIDLETHGEFGHLHIDRLALDFNQRGNIRISGDLHNLHQPDSLRMDVAVTAQGLSNATLADYVPGLHLPDLSRFGTIGISSLTYTGIPLNFHTVFNARSTGAGNASGDVALDLRNHHIVYRAGLKTQEFNIAALVKGPQWESSISADAQVVGTGTNWKTLNTNLTLKATGPSTFQKYRVTNLDLAGSMKQGKATVEHLVGAMEGGPEVNVHSGSIDLVAQTLPFTFNGSINDLPLSEIFSSASKNPARTDITANVSGIAKNFEDLTGTVHARLFDLEYQGHSMQDVTADATLAPGRSGDNKLALQSEIADVTIEHRFRVGDLIHTVPEHINALVTAIAKRDFPEPGIITPIVSQCADSIDFDYYFKIKDLRSLADFFPQTFILGQGVISGSVHGCPAGDISLTMEGDTLGFILRNRTGQTLDTMLAENSIDTSAPALALDTTIINDSVRNVTIHIDSSTIARQNLLRHDSTLTSPLSLPKFGAGAPRIHVTPSATFRLVANNISTEPHQVLGHLDATLDFLADSVIRLGSALFYHPKVGLIYKDQRLDYDLATVYNDVLGFRIKGNARFPNGDLDLAIDTVSGDYLNPNLPLDAPHRDYKWFNDGTSHVLIAKNGAIDIDTLTLIHPLRRGYDPNYAFAHRLSLGGHLQGDSVRAWARVAPFDLKSLETLPMKPTAKTLDFAQFDGTIRNLSLDLNGTMERPEIALNFFADSLKYGVEEIKLDSIAANFSYHDQALRGIMTIHSPRVEAGGSPSENLTTIVAASNTLRAQIDSIPMIIAFKHGPDYSADSAAVLTRPLSAGVDAMNFPIDLATPFIPAFKDLSGSGDIDFDVTGTQQNIHYSGSAAIRNGLFQLAATNLQYLFDGSLTFANNALNLQNITIKNIPADDPYGSALVTGFFDFEGFSITKFDLALHSDRLMVLSNESRGPLPIIYGPLTINTGGSDFHFYNTFHDPAIRGTINIMSAKLTMPQSGSSTQSVSSEGIVYRTLPNDSMLATQGKHIDTLRFKSARAAIGYAVNASSVRMTAIDDTLFPNSMKNVYLNDDGTIRNTDSSTAASETAATTSSSFTDRLRMDVQARIEGDTWINIPFNGLFGILGAQLNAELRSDGPLTIERGPDLISHVTGAIDLTPNSTFRFYQTFNITSGKISFIDNFNNPELNIVAEYIGPDQVTHNQMKLEMNVTGTKNSPLLIAHIYSQSAGGTWDLVQESNTEAQSDVIYFLASGGFLKRELPEANQGQFLANAYQSFGTQVVSSMIGSLSGSTSSAFAIRSAQLSLGTTNTLGLTAAYQNITLHYSTVTNDPLQADYVIDVPMSEVTSGWAARNMLVEIQLHPGGGVIVPGSLVQQPYFLTKFVWTPIRF